MAKDKKSVLIYVDWIATFSKLEDDEAGRLIKHFFSYVNDLNPVSDRLTELLFEPIKQQLKRDLKAYEQTCQRNSLNASLRWNKNNATACDRIQSDAKHADNDIDTDNDNDTDNNSKRKSKRFSPPTLLEVEDYCFERKNTVDASKFIDYYTSNGWKVGKNAMKDWRAAVRTWEKTQNNTTNGNKQQNGLDADAQWRAEMQASIARDYAALHK